MENLDSSNKEVMASSEGERQTLLAVSDNVDATDSADFPQCQAEETTPKYSDIMTANRGEELVKEMTEFGSCDSESSGTEYNSCTNSPKLERATVLSPTHKSSPPISISPQPEIVTDVLPKQQEEEEEDHNNTDSPAPERADNIMRSSPDSMTSSQADVTSGSVSMSANVADKLSQMRVSRESLEGDDYRGDCEDMGMDNKHDTQSSDQEASVGPSRKPSQKSSLRQVFPYISCLPFENNMVFCFVLSVWDNIVGPQTVYVWKRKAFPTQKTFEVFDEPGDIEIGEDTVKGNTQQHHNPTTSHTPHSKNLERQSSNDCVHQKKKKFAGSNMNSLGRKEPKKFVESSPKHISSAKPQDGSTRNISSVESFCEDFGNNILMESLNAIKEDSERPVTTPTAHVVSQPGQQKDAMGFSDRKQKVAPKLSLPRTNNSIPTGELEDRGGKCWTCHY